jgi:CRP/FNR family transcriptional regulator, cyclic AMP receptor protein
VPAARQIRRASRHLAALALPRVEDRVMALFCDLADRWGRATPEGIRIDVPLTHAVIGQLVGARRPTVSLALTDLAAAGRLVRQDERCWLLTADVPLAGVSAS